MLPMTTRQCRLLLSVHLAVAPTLPVTQCQAVERAHCKHGAVGTPRGARDAVLPRAAAVQQLPKLIPHLLQMSSGTAAHVQSFPQLCVGNDAGRCSCINRGFCCGAEKRCVTEVVHTSRCGAGCCRCCQRTLQRQSSPPVTISPVMTFQSAFSTIPSWAFQQACTLLLPLLPRPRKPPPPPLRPLAAAAAGPLAAPCRERMLTVLPLQTRS